MARKRISTAVALAMALPSVAYPLGLGKISIRSVLNQPLRAEIEIFSADPKDLSNLTVRLAPPGDFQKAGIDRPILLSRLRFEMNRRSDGSSIIAIRSSEPIREPFLNFLVEVDWPAGRTVHEYAVLLDPPRLTARPLSPPPVSISEPRLGQQVRRRPTPPPLKKLEEPPDLDLQPTVQYGPVKPNETLWHIAQTLRPSPAVSSQRIMAALLRANPTAFRGGNPNALMSGVTLRTPSADQLRALAQRMEARASKHGQTTPAAEKPAKTVAGALTSPTPTESPTSGPTLKIQNPPQSGQVSQSPGNGTTGAKGQEVPGNLEQRLSQLEENSHVSRKENEELRTRLAESEKQIQGLERNLQVKNEQLAKLQSQFLPSTTQPTPKSTPAQVVPEVLPVVLPTPTVPLTDPLISSMSEEPPLLRPLAPETAAKIANARPIAVKPEPSSNIEQSSILSDPVFIGLLGTFLAAAGFLGRLFIREKKKPFGKSAFSPSNTVQQQAQPLKTSSVSTSAVTRHVLDPKRVAMDENLLKFAGTHTYYPTLSLEPDAPPDPISASHPVSIPSQRSKNLLVPSVPPTPKSFQTVLPPRASVVLPETPTRKIPNTPETNADFELDLLPALEDGLVPQHTAPSWSTHSSPVSLVKPIVSSPHQSSDDIFKETTKGLAPSDQDSPTKSNEENSLDDAFLFDIDFLEPDLLENSPDLTMEVDTSTPQTLFGTQSVPAPEGLPTPEAPFLDELSIPEEEEESEEMENLLQLAKTYLEDGDREGALEKIQEVLDSGKAYYRKKAEIFLALL
ncbi:pilus assembly protein FimV [Gammaproteobacteria bacterium]